MSAISYCFRMLTKALSLLDYDLRHNSASKLYIVPPLTGAVLDTIRMLKANRGWTWKGEYNISLTGDHVLEIFMYTIEGTQKIVRFDDNGNLINIKVKAPLYALYPI